MQNTFNDILLFALMRTWAKNKSYIVYYVILYKTAKTAKNKYTKHKIKRRNKIHDIDLYFCALHENVARIVFSVSYSQQSQPVENVKIK